MYTTILVHHCTDAVKFGKKPLICGCIKKVSRDHAIRMVKNGEAKVMRWTARNGKEYEDSYNVAVLEVKGNIPKAQSISEHHIEQAYVDGMDYHRQRINAYGSMTQDLFFELGASSRASADVQPCQ